MARPVGGRHVTGDDACDRQTDIAGEFIQADHKASLIGPGDVQLGGLGHGPGQALIHAQQHGCGDDPVPAGRIKNHERDRQCRCPAQQQHLLPPDALGQAAGNEIKRSLDEAESHHEGGQQHEGTLGHAEFGLAQSGHYGAHHADGHPDQKYLKQLVGKLRKVFANTVAVLLISIAQSVAHAAPRLTATMRSISAGRGGMSDRM